MTCSGQAGLNEHKAVGACKEAQAHMATVSGALAVTGRCAYFVLQARPADLRLRPRQKRSRLGKLTGAFMRKKIFSLASFRRALKFFGIFLCVIGTVRA